MVSQTRVAIYARVSTLDKGQDPETQLMTLREYAEHRGFQIGVAGVISGKFSVMEMATKSPLVARHDYI